MFSAPIQIYNIYYLTHSIYSAMKELTKPRSYPLTVDFFEISPYFYFNFCIWWLVQKSLR